LTRLSLAGALLLALTTADGLCAQSASSRSDKPRASASAPASRSAARARTPARKPGQLLSTRRPADSARAAVEVPALAFVNAAPAASLALVRAGFGTAAPAAAVPATAGSPATPAALSLRDSIVALARAQLGTRYVLGGTTPERGFDCSGLIRYIAQALRLDVPRTANEQARVGRAVTRDPSSLRPGDLLTFGSGSRISHIGIYIGDGKFIHASTGAGRVVEARLDRKPARGIKPWLGVRRLIAEASGTDG
jgi:cell wall-associated NlpC family hydrolase